MQAFSLDTSKLAELKDLILPGNTLWEVHFKNFICDLHQSSHP